MLHEPAPKDDAVDHATDFKSALGVKLFWVYAVVYAGFVAIGLLAIHKYETIIFAGLNLAVVYGFGLIIFALALALVYDRACSQKEKELNTPGTKGDASSDSEGGNG